MVQVKVLKSKSEIMKKIISNMNGVSTKVTKAEEQSFIYSSRISKLSLSAESVANNNTNNQVLIIGC